MIRMKYSEGLLDRMTDCVKTLYQEYISEFLKKQIDIGRKKFVLYPNGEVAKMVKNILISKYNIVPEYTVDNYSFNGKTILNLEQTKKMQQTDVYYLICSDRKNIYDEIRMKIRQYIDNEQILDVFPTIDNNSIKEEICKKLDDLDEDISCMVKKYVDN